VRRKLINWKEKETKRVETNARIEPEARLPTIIPASVSIPEGACIIVSQNGGTASAWAAAQDFKNNEVKYIGK
jgi:hypothetical protein